jgi:hypothetical protein
MQTIGDELFFTWHTFLQVGKTQNLPSKIWQTLGNALTHVFDSKILIQTNTNTSNKITLTPPTKHASRFVYIYLLLETKA